MKQYQVTFTEDGEIESTVQLPAEPERKRVILVREATKAHAERAAERLYSLAK